MGKQHRDVLRLLSGSLLLHSRAFQKKVGEHLPLLPLVVVTADNDAARMQVVIERLGLPQELWTEDDVLHAILGSHGFRVANRNRGLDDHEDVRIYLQRPLDGIFHGTRVKEVVHIIVIGRCGDDDKLRRLIGCFLIRCRVKVQRPLPGSRLAEKPLNLIVLDRADELVQFLGLRFRGGDSCDFMLLGEQDGEAQSDISYSGYCDLHVLSSPYR